MIRPRLIPCILLKNGLIVRSQLFKTHQIIGNPVSTIHRLSNWNVDELILLDISDDDYHDLRRDDMHVKYAGSTSLDVLKQISEVCFMPLAFGGRIRNIEDIKVRLANGADKCVINTRAVQNPELIKQGAKDFGSQCIVVNIDVLQHEDGKREVYINGGKNATGLDPVRWAKEVENYGAGEIFLNSIDRDGTGTGYDLELIKLVSDSVSIPVIACGGVGTYSDFVKGIKEGNASAVSAANIFHFFELSYPFAKKKCIEAGINMRKVRLDSKWFPREPEYDLNQRDERLAKRMSKAQVINTASAEIRSEYSNIIGKSAGWCSSCVYPAINAAPMSFDDDGVCMGCRTSGNKRDITASEWDERKQILIDIIERGRCKDGSRPDCVIGVSGGKDSYFQTHYIKNVLGYKPLLVTYYGNNYSEVGQRNLLRMKEVFDVDHVIYQPSVTVLKKLNRLGLKIMGDMNWHGHIGICTTPMKIAALHKIPTVIWGEHGYQDLCGQFSMNDFVEWTYRSRLEHYSRGYDWNYMVGLEGIKQSDMYIYQYPTDQEIYDLDLRGVYLSNFTYWEANEHTKTVIKEYGFETSNEQFDRTYRNMSNLDDIHENGVHDYLKYIKFGYGRCTDHATKDVRSGNMSRDKAIELIRHYDHVKPKDLKRWLEYTGMTEEEFDNISDTFRDTRVWWKDKDGWKKRNIWDDAA
ncbi:MAG: imidazole glycerol phosphate synthase subunit HisF [Alphaproteobacteria bacterium CG11_big_fil_rev_8_21_14_0_20_39_49]|nr:MAG: imidazole glycerol phosphate synthase subunit HisF [Alphaproteobacteria bacterium CG11_big_fil_rev_8_21_14_0_20_39_49]